MTVESGRLVVIDSSALVALLADSGPAGTWAADEVAGASLAAPHLALFEASNVLRRQGLSGALVGDQATLAHADLLALPIELWPYAPLAERAWELRGALTGYDASYVALAELFGAPLVTLDARLAKAPGPRCPIRTFPA
ncbi:type II toxin-antitoxin system VapC family toxin [Frankia sp. Cppng1_Ct_nod]|uniref:type II toxin-antitoxin system VapC family toxin n=1 Tax=Frankia sp. Cppng1_Ct_nod TaxID=2897162 RepID=UPI001A94784C|nr:type II toxin-antitoxin system VapC family toxin [Frankia sp. Cppng1_Ct_nod]